MKNYLTFATLIIAASAPLANAAQQNLEARNRAYEPEYARGRILVEPRAGLTAEAFDSDVKRNGGGQRRKMGQSRIHMIDVTPGNEKAVLERLRKNPNYKFVELDQRVEVSAVANDPYAGSEWHLNKIGANTAWDSTQGNGITIAILDSGVDGAHPDLAGRMVPGYNIYSNNTDTSDVCGHGTKAAGSAAAATNNAVGVAGVAGQAKIMPVRIAYNNGGSCYAYFSTMASGVTWAADHGARVVNISYANVPNSAAVQSAANYLRSKGGLLFVSAGNYNRDEGFTPTSTMIAVSATDSYDNRASFSSYGNFVALSAPGAGIYTTVQGGGYGAVNGTSFASPVAAAVAALVMSAKPSLTADQVQNILFTTAKDLGTAGRDMYFGFGRVDAAAAVAAALGTSGGTAPAPTPTPTPADTTAPTVSIANPVGGSTVSGTVSVGVNASDNIGVTRVELKANGTVVATDTAAPYAFAWDSKGVVNGMAGLTAVAYDAAGNARTSTSVSVNVANAVTAPVTGDTIAPTVTVANPVSGTVSGNVGIVVNGSDNAGAAGIQLTIHIDGSLKASGSGSSLSFNWDTTWVSAGSHTIRATAKDAAGNTTIKLVTVTR